MAVENRTPEEVWSALQVANGELVDVRTRPEWTFVGVPDLGGIGKRVHCVEWKRWPDMSLEPRFVDDLLESLGDVPGELFFICRSGARSMEAARAVEAALSSDGRQVTCVNVAEGFEGDLDAHGHRGRVNGWKHRGLPWRQG